MTIGATEKRAELERELRMRRQVYPRWVRDGRMSKELADRRIAVLESILADYPPAQPRML